MKSSFFKGLIPHLKDHKSMVLLGLFIGMSCLAQALFGLGFFASISMSLVAIYGPLVAYEAWDGKRRRDTNLIALRGLHAECQEAIQRFDSRRKARFR